MSRITEKLTPAKNRSSGFIPFVTAGDPDLATSLSIIERLAELGADVIELGIPFSDPMADGPTIQRSSARSLKNGTALQDVLDIAAEFRKGSDVPLVIFSYLNPILQCGVERFADAAEQTGVDGVLFTDVIENEAAELSELFGKRGIDLISLVAPTTTDDRLKVICENARGFVYVVSRAGVTGVREKTSPEAERLVRRCRQFTDLPIAVGFGISTREQIIDVGRYADAAVVGSAIVAEIERTNPTGNILEAVDAFVRQLLPPVAKGLAET